MRNLEFKNVQCWANHNYKWPQEAGAKANQNKLNDVVIFQVLFRKSYCWDFIGAVSYYILMTLSHSRYFLLAHNNLPVPSFHKLPWSFVVKVVLRIVVLCILTAHGYLYWSMNFYFDLPQKKKNKKLAWSEVRDTFICGYKGE